MGTQRSQDSCCLSLSVPCLPERISNNSRWLRNMGVSFYSLNLEQVMGSTFLVTISNMPSGGKRQEMDSNFSHSGKIHWFKNKFAECMYARYWIECWDSKMNKTLKSCWLCVTCGYLGILMLLDVLNTIATCYVPWMQVFYWIHFLIPSSTYVLLLTRDRWNERLLDIILCWL